MIAEEKHKTTEMKNAWYKDMSGTVQRNERKWRDKLTARVVSASRETEV
jgi:hypothetical protein